ncbi:hypothetical protein WJ0W_007154 [Paenibacillus melissococcoides]|uniref:MerR family transcriptional regulator n=1 Tax=Paenibacillus melissococcoides TaxID=2912268 RepID=A0ABM9GBA1_9BACL|nr:hypothetical protein [Paenibacillus melissococcoides]CAH8248487.1 hypothetical protein WJ0W_007154 [Paenibacillus melissococcoides]CAH8722082.1 hypothetical protein HTL2_006686 [Paenibacillus melissococcoides]CAH8722111.1 hypothetical protein WDD9_006625 [Paenibacillus melissococcoides]
MEEGKLQEEQYYQLADFSSKVGKHYTTVSKWFNTLEEKRIHYVTRAADKQRVFDGLDLEIGKLIVTLRDQGWTFDGIYGYLQTDKQETRPFPPDFTSENGQSTDIEEIRQVMSLEFQRMLEQHTQVLNNKLLLIQETNETKKIEERQQTVTNMITNNRINMQLEIEALNKWAALPASERMIRTGVFFKREDTLKRTLYVKQYVLEHFAERLNEELKRKTETDH